MAEGLLAFGVAANIVQFVDFSSRILSAGYQLRESSHATKKNQELQCITSDLEKVTSDLESTPQQNQSKGTLSTDDLRLQELAAQCRVVCVELLGALEQLRFRGQPSRWKTFRAALKSVWSESQIEDLRVRIEQFRQEIMLKILLLLRNEINESSVTQLSERNGSISCDLGRQGLGEMFLRHIEQVKQWQEDYTHDNRQWQASLVHAIHQGDGSLRGQQSGANRLAGEREDHLKNSLLESLYFSEFRDRHDTIPEAYEKTFEWIFGDSFPGEMPWTHFVQWLEGDENLYWITGKAGSGKSTLIKYLFNNVRTVRSLEVWASPRLLVVAAFFFWNFGSETQRSQYGLLRSLLFQLLKKLPELIPNLLPERWEVYRLFGYDTSRWSLQELRNAFKFLASTKVSNAKFFVLIDGLDEFDGDHSDLLGFLKDISSTQLKLCVSSRPWNIFADAFSHQPNLMLQDLTYPDIKHFVSSAFNSHTGFFELKQREPQYANELLDAVAQKVAGVFLWVHLVVQSLLEGLLNSDRVSDLQKRLDSLPPDLENLFERMLKSLEPFYFEHAAQYFQIIRCAEEPPTLLRMSFADEALDFVQKCDVKPLSDREKALRAGYMTRRLNSRCKGLLEVSPCLFNWEGSAFSTKNSLPLALLQGSQAPVPAILSSFNVQYLHRTVKDYIESPSVSDQLLSVTHNDFSPALKLCISFVIELKSLHRNCLGQQRFEHVVERCLRYASQAQEDTRTSGQLDYLTLLLDELDVTAAKLFGVLDKDNSTLDQEGLASMAKCPQGHWTHALLGKRYLPYPNFTTFKFPHSFLSLAARLGFWSYLKARVTNDCLLEGNEGGWSLLAGAVDLNTDLGTVFPWCPFPHIQVIKWLFELGADPNWKLPSGITVWETLISAIRSKRLEYRINNGRERLLQIVVTFLENGADPKTVTPPKFDLNFFNSPPFKLSTEEVQKAQDLAKQKMRQMTQQQVFWREGDIMKQSTQQQIHWQDQDLTKQDMRQMQQQNPWYRRLLTKRRHRLK